MVANLEIIQMVVSIFEIQVIDFRVRCFANMLLAHQIGKKNGRFR